MFLKRFKEDTWLKRTWTATGLFGVVYCAYYTALLINGSFHPIDYFGLLGISIWLIWLGN